MRFTSAVWDFPSLESDVSDFRVENQNMPSALRYV